MRAPVIRQNKKDDNESHKKLNVIPSREAARHE
jgi:hypothetical protein